MKSFHSTIGPYATLYYATICLRAFFLRLDTIADFMPFVTICRWSFYFTTLTSQWSPVVPLFSLTYSLPKLSQKPPREPQDEYVEEM